VAPQEFKGSLTATGVAAAIGEGARRATAAVSIDSIPLSDGGPGFLDALVDAIGGERRRVRVRDPLGRSVDAEFAIIDGGDRAVVESAEAAGLKRLTAGELDALHAGTAGVGDLIRAALDAGVRRLLIGVGGSATNDGGAGMAQALGARLLDSDGNEVAAGGRDLARVASIDSRGLDPRLRDLEVVVASDVRNLLLGSGGASAVFGPQKGADAAAVAELDAALAHFATVVRRDLGVDVAIIPGAGAAGGLAAGLIAFLGAEIRSGLTMVADAVHLDARIAAADLVLTGEGRLDGQTGYGKTVAGIASRAAEAGVPVVALCGGLAPGWRALLDHGLTAAISVIPAPMSLEEAQREAFANVATVAEQVVRLFIAGHRQR